MPHTALPAMPDTMPTAPTKGKDQGRGGLLRNGSKGATATNIEYVIYNVGPETTAKRGAEWFRYGTLQDKTDAVQMAHELFSSREFARVEVHETRTHSATGQRQTRIVKVLADASWKRPIFLMGGACLLVAAMLGAVIVLM